jgi:iron uptake system EfeUOB component EfeO/EfeM
MTVKTILTLFIVSTFALSGCGTTNGVGANTTTDSSDSHTSQEQIASPSVKDGVTKLLDMTKEIKQAIDTGDTNKVKEDGPKLEEIWSSFEDGVKPKSTELYEKIEKYLNPEVAASKAATLDKQTIGTLNDGLIQALNELSQKLQ